MGLPYIIHHKDVENKQNQVISEPIIVYLPKDFHSYGILKIKLRHLATYNRKPIWFIYSKVIYIYQHEKRRKNQRGLQ